MPAASQRKIEAALRRQSQAKLVAATLRPSSRAMLLALRLLCAVLSFQATPKIRASFLGARSLVVPRGAV
jgi:hypothetical protein